MSLSIILVSVNAPAGLKPIARSTNLDLVRHIIITLRDNWLREDDEADVIYDPDFPAEAEQMIACLTDQIRQNIAALSSDVDQ